jgi:hypothetical protein
MRYDYLPSLITFGSAIPKRARRGSSRNRHIAATQDIKPFGCAVEALKNLIEQTSAPVDTSK